MKQIVAIGFQGRERSVIEWRQRMDDDYVEEVELGTNLNSYCTLAGKGTSSCGN